MKNILIGCLMLLSMALAVKLSEARQANDLKAYREVRQVQPLESRHYMEVQQAYYEGFADCVNAPKH